MSATLTKDEAIAKARPIIEIRRKHGDVGQIAKAAGVSRQTLYSWVEEAISKEKAGTAVNGSRPDSTHSISSSEDTSEEGE